MCKTFQIKLRIQNTFLDNFWLICENRKKNSIEEKCIVGERNNCEKTVVAKMNAKKEKGKNEEKNDVEKKNVASSSTASDWNYQQ